MSPTIPNFGELKVLNPRVAWPNEARDFTPGLASHITNLGHVRWSDLRQADNVLTKVAEHLVRLS